LESAVHKLESENLKVTSENKELQAKIDKQNVKLEEALGSSPKTMGRRLTLASVTADLATVTAAMDTMWLLVCGFLIMLMQAGFAMVESGTCRTINVSNILLKNMVDVCVGTLCWFAFGYSFAYGFDSTKADTDVFAGNMNYFGHEFLESNENGDQVATNHPRDWFFQWTFCATGATIVSGGVAERVQFPGYLIFTICMTTYIYPIVVAWMWSTNGWLTAGGKNHLNEVGFNDFAGSGIVHMTGGVAALVGACAVGPRNGRFNESGVDQDAFSPHNLPFLVLGTFILWFGWYGFNCGSTLGVSGGLDKLAAVVAMNTTISASVGGLGVLVLRLAVTKKFDVGGNV
jgi:Amt family ammonium transporter